VLSYPEKYILYFTFSADVGKNPSLIWYYDQLCTSLIMENFWVLEVFLTAMRLKG
jgi:hypothetical protein